MSEILDFYDDDATDYDDKRFAEVSWQDEVHQELLKEFLTDIPEESRILEIGCGTGRFTTTLVERGYETTAVDISPTMLQKTRHRCRNNGSITEPTLLCGDVTKLPFDENYFDACVMVNVASHLPAPRRAFSEISRVVCRGGTVFTNFTNLSSPYLPIGLLVNLRGQSVQDDVYSHWYSRSEIDEILSQCGFKPHRLRGHMIPPRKKYPIVDQLIKTVDTLSRDSLLRFFAGNRFYHLEVTD